MIRYLDLVISINIKGEEKNRHDNLWLHRRSQSTTAKQETKRRRGREERRGGGAPSDQFRICPRRSLSRFLLPRLFFTVSRCDWLTPFIENEEGSEDNLERRRRWPDVAAGETETGYDLIRGWHLQTELWSFETFLGGKFLFCFSFFLLIPVFISDHHAGIWILLFQEDRRYLRRRLRRGDF